MKSNATPVNDQPSLLGKKWMMKDVNDKKLQLYAQRFNVPEILARLMVARDIEENHVEDYLNPTLKKLMGDPHKLLDMDKAVARFVQALDGDEKIAVFGDYDVDGATSSALLKRFLRDLGHECLIYIPDRIDEGYGPTPGAFDYLKSQGVKLVVTVDCGATSFEPLAYADSIGLDVVVLDHHTGEPKLPKAKAVVNPNRLDQESNPYNICAAVGVTFLFAACVLKALREKGAFQSKTAPDILNYLDLVATGTVCDVMQLRDLNRAFVHQGLKIMARRQNLGLKALCDHAGLDQAPHVYHLGFVIGPRINAGGRVGKADLGARLLSTQDPLEAANIAAELSQFNLERQEIEQGVLAQALDQAELQADEPFICVQGQGWHPGVIGIVAGRIKEKFHKPTAVIAFDDNGIGKASARSVTGVDLGSMIHCAKQKGLLVAGGGHAMAGGFTIEMQQLESFKDFMRQQIFQSNADLTPYASADAYLALEAGTVGFVKSLAQLEPYGQGNPQPRFILENVSVIKVDVVGQGHLRLVLKSFAGNGTLKAMAFRALETPLGHALMNRRADTYSFLGTFKLDTWMGSEQLTFFIDDGMSNNLEVSRKIA